MTTARQRSILLALSLLLVSVLLTACPRPLPKVDKVIAFPFTVDNIKNPDLTGPAITKAPLGTAFALVGSGFSRVAKNNTVSVGGIETPAWASGTDYAVFFLAGFPQDGITEITLATEGRSVDVTFELDTTLPEVADPDAVIDEYRMVMKERFLRSEVRDLLEGFAPELVDDLDALRPGFASFEAQLPDLTSAEKLNTAALIDQSGFLKFFSDNPPATIRGTESPGATPNLVGVDVAITAAEIAAGAAIVVAVIAVVAKDDPPDVDVEDPLFTPTEGLAESFECTADDTGVGESGLNTVTPFLNKGEGSLNPPSGQAQSATSDPFTLSITLTAKKTGRSRDGNISCRAKDAKGNLGFDNLDFVIREFVNPKIDSATVEGPDPTKKLVGEEFKVTITTSDKPLGPGDGEASGIDKLKFALTNLSGPAEIDVTPGKAPGPPEEDPGPQSDTQVAKFTCTRIGAAEIKITVLDTAENSVEKTVKLECIQTLSSLDLNDLPAGPISPGSYPVGILDSTGASTGFIATIDVVDANTLTNEGGQLFLVSGSGFDGVFVQGVAGQPDPLKGRVNSVVVTVDPVVCGGDASYALRTFAEDGSDLGVAIKDTSLGEFQAEVKAAGIAMFRIESLAGPLCPTRFELDLDLGPV